MKGRAGHFALILCCFLLQGTLLEKISIGGIRPNLAVVLCVCFGLIKGRKSGLWTGFFSGLFIDLFYGSLFGFYALVYMYLGFLCGYAHRVYYDDDIKVPLAMTAAADFLFNLAVFGLQFLLRGRQDMGLYLVRIILPEVFYTSFLAFFVYYPLRALIRLLGRAQVKESESIWKIK